MCLATNISRRAGSASYYARLAVPKDLQPILGRRELWKSLNTKDAREARALVAAVVAEWHADFRELRRRAQAQPATVGDLQAETFNHYQGELERHHTERRALPSRDEIEAAKAEAKRTIRAERIADPLAQVQVAAEAMVLSGQAELSREFRSRHKAELQHHLARGEFVLVADAAREIIRARNYAIEPGTPAWRDLCEHLMRAEIEGHRRAEEHDRGDYTGRPRDPIVKAPAGKPAPPVAAPGETIIELFDVFATENPRSVKPDTLRMNREIIVWFSQHVGATFTGCLADGKEHRPGNVRPRDHRYWLPLLALFTGARMGELAQLLTADVRQDRGRWIFHVTREGDAEKTTKTKGSQRVIPVHPELERLGFIAFHAQRLAAGDRRMFPEIKPDARGHLAGNYSRFWGRYVKRIGVKDDASVNFHSFRHGMAEHDICPAAIFEDMAGDESEDE